MLRKILVNGLLFMITALSVYLILFAILFFIAPGGIPLIYRTSKGNVWEGGGTYVKFREFNCNEKWDIVILGSSHAYRGYDPRIFAEKGYKTFNLGTSDQNMMCSYYIAKNYLNRSNCRMVILDLYDRVFTQQNLESMSDVVHNITSDKAAFQVAMSSRDIRGLNMFTLRQFNKLRPPLNTDTAGFIRGFFPTNTYLTPPAKKRIVWTYHTNKFQIDYLRKLIEYLQSEGIQLVLAEHPMPAPYTPQDHKLFVSDIQKIADEYQVPYLDYMKDSSMTGIRYFADETHLNVEGVTAYNNKLINDMISGKLLPLNGTGNSTTNTNANE
jgi:hypothetical protein